MQLLRLEPGARATLEVRPEKGLDMGAGPGKPLSREVTGGMVGVILDARGRPLRLPDSHADRRAAVEGWLRALEVY
jgi:hypothetical protein